MDRVFKQIVKKATLRIKNKIKPIERKQNEYLYEIEELRQSVKNIRFMIDNLKLDLDNCTKKSKTYIVNKILDMKDLETLNYNKIRKYRSIVEDIQCEVNLWEDIISDEYHELNY